MSGYAVAVVAGVAGLLLLLGLLLAVRSLLHRLHDALAQLRSAVAEERAPLDAAAHELAQWRSTRRG